MKERKIICTVEPLVCICSLPIHDIRYKIKYEIMQTDGHR